MKFNLYYGIYLLLGIPATHAMNADNKLAKRKTPKSYSFSINKDKLILYLEPTKPPIYNNEYFIVLNRFDNKTNDTQISFNMKKINKTNRFSEYQPKILNNLKKVSLCHTEINIDKDFFWQSEKVELLCLDCIDRNEVEKWIKPYFQQITFPIQNNDYDQNIKKRIQDKIKQKRNTKFSNLMKMAELKHLQFQQLILLQDSALLLKNIDNEREKIKTQRKRSTTL